MIRRSLRDIQVMVNGFGLYQTLDLIDVAGVSIDTRTIRPGNLYIPIIRIDNGHKYVQEAMDKGAVASLWQRDQPHPPKDVPLIFVDDTLEALQKLSKEYRNQLKVKVIGVTGSNGKTTTKDMIHSILSTIFKTQKTIGNFNGEYGLPLTLLELEEETQVAILEMGMSNAGEISLLSRIARPDIAIITMIGVSHISTLGSKEAITKAKLEILDGLNPEGAIILHGDEPLLSIELSKINLPKSIRIIRFGELLGNDYYPINQATSEEGIHFKLIDSQDYLIPMLGKHNILNALASIAAAKELSISVDNIQLGLKNLIITEMRMQQIKTASGYTIINDAWNASPASMKAAIQTLQELQGYNKKILVLGDMLELGENEVEYHREISLSIHFGEIDYLFTIGKLSGEISQLLKSEFPLNQVLHFSSEQELIETLNNVVEENDVLLIKGSRGMKLEEVVKELLSLANN